MESTQQIQNHLKSVKNIGQITKAMELVAATKMRKSQEAALASRPYSFAAFDLLAVLSQLEANKFSSPFLEKRLVKNTLFVLVTSDKGLAGAFNSSVIRNFESYAATNKIDLAAETNLFFAVGKKAAAYLNKKNVNLIDKAERIGDFIALEQVRPLIEKITQGYLAGDWDRVIIFSTHFQNAFKQVVIPQDILPVSFDNLKKIANDLIPISGRYAELIKEKRVSFFNQKVNPNQVYLIEPSPQAVFENLVPHLLTMHLYHLILEANASEHAARRTVMKSASDNADQLVEGLTLYYNKIRQARITTEIVEIIASTESLNEIK